MNTDFIVSLSNEQLLPILQYLPLKSLLNCQQTCRELDQKIFLLFDHDRDEIGKIFKRGNPVFSIICTAKDLKIQLAVNKFFKNSCFKEFMHNWNLKFVKDIFPFAAYGKMFFGPSPGFIPIYKRVASEHQSESQEMAECFKRGHPIFEKEMFILCEEHGFSSCLADSLVNEYLEKKNSQLFSFACNIGAGFGELLGFNEPKVISVLETMYNKLFKGYVQQFVTRIKEDTAFKERLQSCPMHLEIFKHHLTLCCKPENLSSIPELNALTYLDGILADIQNELYPRLPQSELTQGSVHKEGFCGVTLTKPHVTLVGRMRGEFSDAVNAMLDDFALNL